MHQKQYLHVAKILHCRLIAIQLTMHALEIYCCLLNGHTLVIPDREERVNPTQLQQLINKHRVTVASIPLFNKVCRTSCPACNQFFNIKVFHNTTHL
jgi:hypothetical protein